MVSSIQLRYNAFRAVLIKVPFVCFLAMMGTEGIAATVIEDPEPSIPPGFGPFAAPASWGNDVKPADAHSSSDLALQSIADDVEILECLSSSVDRQSDTGCSISGSNTCRKSLRNRPPIDYSRFDQIAYQDSDAEVADKVALTVLFHPYFFTSYLNFIMMLMARTILLNSMDRV